MPVDFRKATLDNGLTVIAEIDPAALTAAVGFFVRTGARDEAPGVMGVSHFLEHMMFKGTARRTSDDVNRDFDRIGARANAYTSSEMTAFYASTLHEHLPEAVDVLADMMRPALRDADFDTEKGVILEEIAMYKDDPVWVLYERLLAAHYGAHGLAHRVLGLPETIGPLTAPQMRDYFGRRYSADNTVVALAGRVDFDARVEQLRALCAGWANTDASRDASPPRVGGAAFTQRDARVARAYRMSVGAAPGDADDDRYAAAVAAMLLGGPDNSRLHWALVEPGLAEEAEASVETKDGIGDFRLFVACEPEALDEVWTVVERELAALPDTATQADVDRIRAKLATAVTLAGERPEGRMHRLGRQWTSLRRYSTLEHELERYQSVTLQDVRRVATRLAAAPRTTGTLLPEATS
ncbi:MAG: insulinase family protein [Phycisphaeraceae bacterium]|nr:insulinase family protein [Phycisphaeraceae bacterium]